MPPRKGPYGAGGSEQAGRVMEPRKVESRGHEESSQGCVRGKPTVCTRRKAAVLGTLWHVRRTPPGSASGQVCIGGTRERGRATGLLDHRPGMGDRVIKSPGVVGGFYPIVSGTNFADGA